MHGCSRALQGRAALIYAVDAARCKGLGNVKLGSVQYAGDAVWQAQQLTCEAELCMLAYICTAKAKPAPSSDAEYFFDLTAAKDKTDAQCTTADLKGEGERGSHRNIPHIDLLKRMAGSVFTIVAPGDTQSSNQLTDAFLTGTACLTCHMHACTCLATSNLQRSSCSH